MYSFISLRVFSSPRGLSLLYMDLSANCIFQILSCLQRQQIENKTVEKTLLRCYVCSLCNDTLELFPLNVHFSFYAKSSYKCRMCLVPAYDLYQTIFLNLNTLLCMIRLAWSKNFRVNMGYYI